MIERLTEDELALVECLSYSISASECLFADLENLLYENEEQLGSVRLYQFPLFSYEYLLDYDNKLTAKENFKLREGAGKIDCFGGRLFGKSHCVERLDICVSIFNLPMENVGFTSVDILHIRGILEDLILVFETNMFFKDIFLEKINRSPNYRIAFKNGYVIESINMNIQSRSPGQQFFQKHLKRLYIEEASLETEEVYKKRIDAVSEFGCIVRSAGMTDFTKFMPAGKRYYDAQNKPWVCNLPQYCNPLFDKTQKEKSIKKYGGENSISYRIYVKGEIVEEGISVMDMQRVRANYLPEDKIVKKFEITKNNFEEFERILIVEKPEGADAVFICADIGESAPTEIIILFKKGKKFYYHYNITVYNLTDKEQTKIFDFLIQILKANITGIDTTDGTGRAIYRSLEEKYTANMLAWCSFNEKLPVDFEKDEKGNILFDKDGKPMLKEEYVSEWSIKRLKDLLYEAIVLLPVDFVLDKQLNSIVGMKSGQRMVYEVVGAEDHLLSAFRVFAIAEWQKNAASFSPVNIKIHSKIGC